MIDYPPVTPPTYNESFSKDEPRKNEQEKQLSLLELKKNFMSCSGNEKKIKNLVAPCVNFSFSNAIPNSENIEYNIETSCAEKNSSRRVCFHRDDNDCLEACIHTYEAAPLECQSDLHWSQEELARIRQVYNEDAVMCKIKRHDIVENIRFLFSGCGSKEQEEEAIRNLTTSRARGMERRMLDCLMRKERRTIIRKVLDLQAIMISYSPEKREMMLGKRCAKLTEQSVNLAVKIASGDYLYAFGLYTNI